MSQTRRAFLARGGMLLAAAGLPLPAVRRPQLQQGIAIGDVVADRALVWTRTDRPAQLIVEWDTHEAFRAPRVVRGPLTGPASDFTARVDLSQLPAGERIFLRARCDDGRTRSEPVLGSFRAAPAAHSNLRIVWSGDTVGQGFGINPDIGGLRGYEAMRVRQPDLFIHCGDTIYADERLKPEVTVEDGKRWRNLVTPEKSKVAETLQEFRGNYRYNLLDDNVKRFNAQVPQLWLWDDHEVCNNWSSSKDLTANRRYVEKNVAVLAARARRAFLEYAPNRFSDPESDRIYRQVPFGPLLDIFVLDMRSYRGPNTHNLQPESSADSAFLGRPQLQWLQQALSASSATWKLIAADMPLGLIVRDGKDAQGRERYDGISNGSGPALGRERELAELLRFIKRERIHNVVFITADVHYTAAHYYDPGRARFADFDPFWEFVSGPIHAGGFGPNDPDDTFGLQVVYQKAPPALYYSPLSEYQFFGELNLDARERTLTVSLRDVLGHTLFERTLSPQHA